MTLGTLIVRQNHRMTFDLLCFCRSDKDEGSSVGDGFSFYKPAVKMKVKGRQIWLTTQNGN